MIVTRDSHVRYVVCTDASLLVHQMRERELGVFFRNNHFSTVFKVRPWCVGRHVLSRRYSLSSTQQCSLSFGIILASGEQYVVPVSNRCRLPRSTQHGVGATGQGDESDDAVVFVVHAQECNHAVPGVWENSSNRCTVHCRGPACISLAC